MPRTPGTTNRQTAFLRLFRTRPFGPAPEDWPSPAILRRWLRRPAFRAALESVLTTLRIHTDFAVSTAATHAACNLEAFDSGHTARVTQLLRLAHLRERVAPLLTPPDDAPPPIQRNTHTGLPMITSKELHTLALNKFYSPPIYQWSDFPPPVPQDTFYFKLIQNPSAYLWYINQYAKATGDPRYNHILNLMKDHIPWFEPNEKSPGFPPGSFPQPAAPSQPPANGQSSASPVADNLPHGDPQ